MSQLAWLTLVETPGLGPMRGRALVEAADSVEAAAAGEGLDRVKGIGSNRVATLRAELRKAAARAVRRIEQADRLGLNILTPSEDDWPAMLADLADAPLVLWCWGRLEARDLHAVGIVGSREPTVYGREQAGKFANRLATNGVTVVSGGAYGVDTAAHRGALAATGGRTLVVLGSGCDVAYPAENEQLFAQVADGCGAVLSELPPGTRPRREHFPRRNRIISGLSRGVLVIEAAQRSGALITARVAADDHNRPVFALPGRVDNPMAAGPLVLLRDGARLALSPDDLLDNLGPLPHSTSTPKPSEPELFQPPREPEPAPVAPASPDEQRLLDALHAGPQGPDALCDATGLPAAKVQTLLTMLSVRGLITRLPDNTYERRR
ncbi:MAG: DNA-processing protein DprA [Planctomycetota bacterium]